MKSWTEDDVFDYMLSFTTSAALGAAMELGLFWLLRERPLDAAGVSQALEVPGNRCQYLLQLLQTIGLVEQVSGEWVPSETAQTAILDSYSQQSWAFLAREARKRLPAVLDLSLHMRESGSTWEAQGLTPPDYFAQLVESPERARQFTRMLYEAHQPMAAELARMLDMTGVRRMMDVGGGSGVMSLALLRRYPDLTSVVVDIENVCVAGREIAAEHAEADRIDYHAMDFLRDEFPGTFDLVLVCDVGISQEALPGKIRSVLNPGGRLVVIDQYAPTRGVAHGRQVYWAFLSSMHNPQAAFRTMAEDRDRLVQAGYQVLSEISLDSDWTVIVAGE